MAGAMDIHGNGSIPGTGGILSTSYGGNGRHGHVEGKAKNVKGRPYSRGNLKKLLANVAGAESKKGIENLVEEIEADEKFYIGTLTIKSLIQSAKVSIEVEGNENAQYLADNLMKRFTEALPHACRAIGFGRVVFEKWYAGYDPQTGQNHIGGLEPLPYCLTSMIVAGGEYAGTELKVTVEKGNGETEVEKLTIPRRASWWFALDPTPEQPQGKSRYLGVPEKVLARRKYLNDAWNIFGGRAANGITIVKAPKEYSATGTEGQGTIGELDSNGEPLNPVVELVESCELAEDGGVIGISSEVYPESNVPMFDISTQPVQSSADPLKAMDEREDNAVMESLGLPPKALDNNTGVGSYAQAETFLKTLHNTIESILAQIITSFQKQVIDDAVAVNFGKSALLTMTWQPMNEDRTAFILDVVKSIMTTPGLSPLVANGAIDIDKLLEISGLPPGADLDGALLKVKEGAAAMLVAQQQPPQPQFGGQPQFPPARQLAISKDPPAVPPPSESWPDALAEMIANIRRGQSNLSQTLGESTDWGHL